MIAPVLRPVAEGGIGSRVTRAEWAARAPPFAQVEGQTLKAPPNADAGEELIFRAAHSDDRAVGVIAQKM